MNLTNSYYSVAIYERNVNAIKVYCKLYAKPVMINQIL